MDGFQSVTRSSLLYRPLFIFRGSHFPKWIALCIDVFQSLSPRYGTLIILSDPLSSCLGVGEISSLPIRPYTDYFSSVGKFVDHLLVNVSETLFLIEPYRPLSLLQLPWSRTLVHPLTSPYFSLFFRSRLWHPRPSSTTLKPKTRFTLSFGQPSTNRLIPTLRPDLNV